MKKAVLTLVILYFASAVFAGFKVKNIKPKKPGQFQSQVTIGDVTYAADLLLDGKDQKSYFHKALAPSNLIAVRLAVFNNGKDEVILPLDGIELLASDGNGIHLTSPELAAQAVLQGATVLASSQSRIPKGQVGVGGIEDARTDPTDPRYDPRLDPNSPSYDPSDPRNRGQYPPGSYPSGGTWGRPGIILNPGGGEDLSQYERQLAEKDFCDKAHTSEPVLSSTNRDRFLYFSIEAPLAETKGYTLRLPVSRGIPQEVILKF